MPSSCEECNVREYRCGWKRTTTRAYTGGDVGVPRHNSRAAAIAASTLRAIVCVVVHDEDAADLADPLEPATDALELGQDALRLLPLHARELERGDRSGRIPAVVLPRHREVDLHRRERVAAHDLRHLGEPALEHRLHLGPRAELGVVVEIDVEDDGDLRPERLDRPVGFVTFDHEPAGPRARVAPELRHVAADDERRVPAETVEDERDHGRGRRLAVRTGDDDRRLRRHELGEERGP